MTNVPRKLLCLAVLSALATVGCAKPTDPVQATHEALTGTLAALRATGSVSVELDVSVTSSALTHGVDWKATRRIAFGSPDRATVEGGATVLVPGPGPRRNVDLTEIVIGKDRYYQSLRMTLPAGKKWAKVDERTTLSFGGQFADPDLGVLDPLPFLQLLADLQRVDSYGAQTETYEELNGVRTRRYNVLCGLNKNCATSAFPSAFNSLFNGESPITISVFLDEQNRPHKLIVDGYLDTGARAADDRRAGYDLDVTMTFTDFGQPVEISAPPADQTTDDFRITP